MLYVRHGQKAYANGRSNEFSLDPGLTEHGRCDAKVKFLLLLEQYGIPTKIISSPFLRARETSNIARDIIFEVTSKAIEISCDPLLGEYLGNQTHRNMNTDLRPETLLHHPIPPEKWKQYGARIRNHVKLRSNEYVWYITHGVVIQSIASLHSLNVKRPAELEGIYIDLNGNVTSC